MAKRKKKYYWYHPESGSAFMTKLTKKQLERFMNTPDGGLCNLISKQKYKELKHNG